MPDDLGLDELQLNAVRTKGRENYEEMRKYLGWKPLNVIKDTVMATTRYAKHSVRLPMRRHYKSRFPALVVNRLDELYATDSLYASCKAHDGSTCAQLYKGKSSAFTKCMGMKTDGEFHRTLMDFIRKYGAMRGLFSDNAKASWSYFGTW